MLSEYRSFLEAKRPIAPVLGAAVDFAAVHPVLKDFQAAIVRWAVQGGRRAIFAKFGLGKGMMQQEVLRLATPEDAISLAIAPLGVRTDFFRDARVNLGREVNFVRTTDELRTGIVNLTNYESVRDGKIDVSRIHSVSLDEASCLRGFGGTKTFREFMRLFEHTPIRLVATATPAPNEYIELLAYAAFLGVMDVGEAKTRFFKRNSEKADQLTIHPHKEEEFWLWVNSWAVFVQSPSDLGFSDEGYDDLPPPNIRWHMVESGVADAGSERDGQHRLLRNQAMGVVQAASEKRATLDGRVAFAAELVAKRPDDHCILWHDLEDERKSIERSIPDVTSVYGSQDLDDREELIRQFADGEISRLGAKPVMLGSGCNLQRHCWWAVFVGIGHKFNDFIQAVHRLQRFQQPHAVDLDIIFARSEGEVKLNLEAKWRRYDELMARMREIVRKYGLNAIAAQESLVRSIGVERRVIAGSRFEVVNADCVEETARMADNSVGLIVTSIPFGTQYEYTPSYNDFGHTDNDEHFFRQMDFLGPELLRVLKPGRVLAVHVKDRIRPGGMDSIGFQTASPFHAETILHYRRHGFWYMGMITVTTDVVRENNQTYRLSYTQQCKDGSRMGVGMPEYILLFRKAPTDSSDGYADERVEKSKDDYKLSRWQIDAHALWKSRGNRLLDPAELVGAAADIIYKKFRGWSFAAPHDHEHHVAIAQALADNNQLPPTFMLLPPVTDHDAVWTDVARMRTLNGVQEAQGREMHLCPLQFDIVDRLINRFSNADDEVYDPFGGLMTVPLCALKLGRRGRGVELNPAYFNDGVRHLKAAELKIATPTLFDLLEVDQAAA